jgi:hypothetical protein
MLDGHGSHVTYGSHKTSTTTWVGYGHLTFLHFPCFIALKCELFQAFQIYFQKIKNNHLEPDKFKLVGWVDNILDQTLSPKNIVNEFIEYKFDHSIPRPCGS